GAPALRGAGEPDPEREHQGDLRSGEALRRRAPHRGGDGRGGGDRGGEGARVEERGRAQDRRAARGGGAARGRGGGGGAGRGGGGARAAEVSDAISALRAGAAALLDAQGEARLARVVRAARVEIAGAGEAWAMGSRQVTAHRVALVVPAAAFVELGADAA